MTLRTALVPCLVLVTAPFLTACGADEPVQHPETARALVELKESVDALTAETRGLRKEVRRQGGQLSDLAARAAFSESVAATPPAAAAHPAPADGHPAAAMQPAVEPGDELDAGDASEIPAALATPAGRRALELAAQRVDAEREARQRDTFVAYSLARFAEEAGLDEVQRKDVQKVWDDVMADARSMMKDFRGVSKLPQEEREKRMLEMRTSMRDLGERRTERMRSILTDGQFELYQAKEKEIDAGLHGAPQRDVRDNGESNSAER